MYSSNLTSLLLSSSCLLLLLLCSPLLVSAQDGGGGDDDTTFDDVTIGAYNETTFYGITNFTSQLNSTLMTFNFVDNSSTVNVGKCHIDTKTAANSSNSSSNGKAQEPDVKLAIACEPSTYQYQILMWQSQRNFTMELFHTVDFSGTVGVNDGKLIFDYDGLLQYLEDFPDDTWPVLPTIAFSTNVPKGWKGDPTRPSMD